jgi:two-component system NtrC family sensor kinase
MTEKNSPPSRKRASAADRGDTGAAITGSGDATPTVMLQALADSVREAAVAIDGRRKILHHNAVFVRRFGTPDPGATVHDLVDPPGLRNIIKAALDSDEVQRAELTVDGNAGSDEAFNVTVVPLQNDVGKAKLLVLFDDVSELTERRNRMVANSRLVSVGEMAAGVAHELNNPLTAVLGFSQLALRQVQDPELRKDLESIASEAERAGIIVDNLLGFARAKGASGNYFDPAASIKKILDLREYECRVNNIEVVTYFDPDTPHTLADAHRMEQVFLNLLGNSIQAIADGSGRGTITVGLVAIDERIRVSFTDDGPGIPADVLPRIFEPFYTTKPVGKGTGLGLSICQEIVRDHGGEIRVESHPRRGTTFVVEIPVIAIEAPDTAKEEKSETPRSYSLLRVLAVDDEPVITDLLARAIGGLGHEVDVASDGAEALRKINMSEYDAILLDVKMPGLGGPEVLRCIEGLRPELANRVLFITGDTVSPNTEAFFQAAGRDVLHKPFSLDELRNSLEQFAVMKDRRSNTGERPDLRAGISRIPRSA